MMRLLHVSWSAIVALMIATACWLPKVLLDDGYGSLQEVLIRMASTWAPRTAPTHM
jgi:hypothetical protein